MYPALLFLPFYYPSSLSLPTFNHPFLRTPLPRASGPPGGVSRTLNLSYLRPLPLPAKVRVHSRVIQQGKTLGMATAELRGVDSDGNEGKVFAVCEHHKAKVQPVVGSFVEEGFPDGAIGAFGEKLWVDMESAVDGERGRRGGFTYGYFMSSECVCIFWGVIHLPGWPIKLQYQ